MVPDHPEPYEPPTIEDRTAIAEPLIGTFVASAPPG